MPREHAVMAIVGALFAILPVGCAIEEAAKDYTLFFRPQAILQDEFADRRLPTHEFTILPQDIDSRPAISLAIEEYMAINKSGSHEKALNFIKETVERAESDFTPRDTADLQLILASAFYSRGKHADAETSCDRAIELDPANWRAFHFRALLREHRGATQGYQDDMQRVSELRNGKPMQSYSAKSGII